MHSSGSLISRQRTKRSAMKSKRKKEGLETPWLSVIGKRILALRSKSKRGN